MLPILNAILPVLGPILEKLIPDANKRAEAQEALTKAVLDNQVAILQASKDVMVADAQSEGWLTRNARPLTVVWSLGVMTWIIAVAPIFGLVEATLGALKAIPDNLWNVMLVGIGGYTLARSVENGVRNWKGNGGTSK